MSLTPNEKNRCMTEETVGILYVLLIGGLPQIHVPCECGEQNGASNAHNHWFHTFTFFLLLGKCWSNHCLSTSAESQFREHTFHPKDKQAPSQCAKPSLVTQQQRCAWFQCGTFIVVISVWTSWMSNRCLKSMRCIISFIATCDTLCVAVLCDHAILNVHFKQTKTTSIIVWCFIKHTLSTCEFILFHQSVKIMVFPLHQVKSSAKPTHSSAKNSFSNCSLHVFLCLLAFCEKFSNHQQTHLEWARKNIGKPATLTVMTSVSFWMCKQTKKPVVTAHVSMVPKILDCICDAWLLKNLSHAHFILNIFAAAIQARLLISALANMTAAKCI